MSKDIVQFARALDFAARKHAHQRRKGELEEPYINHLADVTVLLAAATDGRDTVLVRCPEIGSSIAQVLRRFEQINKSTPVPYHDFHRGGGSATIPALKRHPQLRDSGVAHKGIGHIEINCVRT